MTKKTEIEIAEQVVDWLEGRSWDVYQEVQFSTMGKVADIVAVGGEELWIVECKTSFGLAVLDQAYSWHVSMRSVAVPFSRNRVQSWMDVARDYYQVGIIEIYEDSVDELIEPPYMQRNFEYQKTLLKQLSEEHKTFAKAGSQAGSHLTTYKASMILVKEFIEKNPNCSVIEIVNALGKLHYSHETSAKGNLRTALLHYEKDWVEVSSKPLSHPNRFTIKQTNHTPM